MIKRNIIDIIISVILFASLFIMTGCSSPLKKEMARLSLKPNNTETQTTSLVLQNGDTIAFWSKMDMEYQEKANIHIFIDVKKDNALQETIIFDPREKNITIGEVRKTIGNNTSWRFTGKNRTLPIVEDGTYTFDVQLVTSPPSVTIHDAELILKK